MKRLRPAIRPYSGLLLAGAVLLQANLLPAQNIPIAVVEFEGNGISQTEAIALTDRLRNELFRLGAFEVVERGMMETILTEQDFQLTGCTSNDCLVEVGQLLGARQVVGGRISRIGAMFTVSARVVDVETGKLLEVSDFDLRGEIDDMLTRGMEVVALMLSGDEEGAMRLRDELSTGMVVETIPDRASNRGAVSPIYFPIETRMVGYYYKGKRLKLHPLNEEGEDILLSLGDEQVNQLVSKYKQERSSQKNRFWTGILLMGGGGGLIRLSFDDEGESTSPLSEIGGVTGVAGLIVYFSAFGPILRQPMTIRAAVERYNQIVEGQ